MQQHRTLFWLERRPIGYRYSCDIPGHRTEGWRPTRRWAVRAARARIRAARAPD